MGYTILLAIFTLSQINALEFSEHENNSKTLNAIMATGEIEYNDVEKLDRYLSELPKKKHIAIYFDSPGGNLLGGIRLGKYFKDHGIKTVIQGKSICASACALAFLGGTDRNGNKWMSSTTTSYLGFHAFSKGDGTRYADSDQTQMVVAEILKYGYYVNAPMEIFIKQFSTPSHDMYWFSKDEELKLGIKVWDTVSNRFLENETTIPKTEYKQYERVSEFMRRYFTSLKKVPYEKTWNMLSNNMKRKLTFTQYVKWWDRQVKKIEIKNIKVISKNKVMVSLKYYMQTGRTICSLDTFTLKRTNGHWLIDAQKYKNVTCN
jgi:hypothetical protein